MPVLLYKFGIGDYRVVLVNFNIDELIDRRVKVCSPLMRQLIHKNQQAIDNYNFRVVELIKFHNIKK